MFVLRLGVWLGEARKGEERVDGMGRLTPSLRLPAAGVGAGAELKSGSSSSAIERDDIV